jgi:hypothetical protein
MHVKTEVSINHKSMTPGWLQVIKWGLCHMGGRSSQKNLSQIPYHQLKQSQE